MRTSEAAVLGLLFIVSSGCVGYRVHISTFPPVEADVYVDDRKVGRTTERGEAIVHTGTRWTICADPSYFVLSIRSEGQLGVMRLKCRGAPDERAHHVVESQFVSVAPGWGIYVNFTFDSSIFDVTFSFDDSPLTSPAEWITEGGNRVGFRNDNDEAVWVGVRDAGRGANAVFLAGEVLSFGLPDGSYEILFICESTPTTVQRVTGDIRVERQDYEFVIPSCKPHDNPNAGWRSTGAG
jgi:hypothetical protein